MSLEAAIWIPWLPLIATVLCTICAFASPLKRFAAPIMITSMFAAFFIVIGIYGKVPIAGDAVHAFTWMDVIHPDGKSFYVDFGYYLDSLTLVMLLVVTGIGSMIVVYSAGYMEGDRGYARFFAFVGLFIFAMTTVAMADNLVLLFLGWEMVGLASYLLIGFYYKKPSAVAAAKKAFIVNRVGDFGFLIGIFCVYHAFGSIYYVDIIPAAQAMLGQTDPAMLTETARASYERATGMQDSWPMVLLIAPFMLMLGAFGKSAQLPFHVWLPDAMEGPTPVSALIHAATMVTSGVYMIARLIPVFELSPYALPTVATIGGLTAFFAATIAVTQYDLKRVFAFSTVSQLGYMFLGVGVLSTTGAIFHLMTHAFFKALLFLTAGNVMHAMAGQLDIRKMSGLGSKMPVTKYLMLAGCLALAAFPFTSGFFSKDLILATAIEQGIDNNNTWFIWLGIIGLIAAFFTACYAFRAWFRVFTGPTEYEMGDETHHEEEEELYATDDHDVAKTDAHGHKHEPHEMPWFPINAPLVVLAIGALFAGFLGVGFDHVKYGWIGSMIRDSTAYVPFTEEHHYILGIDLHLFLQLVSGALAISGIALAWYLHSYRRDMAAKFAALFGPLTNICRNKYYMDELYAAIFVKPLRILAHAFYVFDHLVIDGIVTTVAYLPKMLGVMLRPTQTGRLQSYGLGMVAGLAVIALLVLLAMRQWAPWPFANLMGLMGFGPM